MTDVFIKDGNKFELGQKVRIKNFNASLFRTETLHFNPSMKEHCGETATVTGIEYFRGCYIYHLQPEGQQESRWVWLEDWLVSRIEVKLEDDLFKI